MSNLSHIELDDNIQRIRIESLGSIITNINQTQFREILNSVSLSGVYDITKWTSSAVRVLLEVCAQTNQHVTLKHGNRYLMPIKYPTDTMLETFVEAIISNSF